MKLRFASFLVALLTYVFIGPPLIEAGYGTVVILAVGPLLMITAAFATGHTRALRVPVVIVAATAMFGEITVYRWPKPPVALAAGAVNAAFLAFAAVDVLRHILRQKRVTADTILGGICVYLLIGIAFVPAFTIVENARPGSFLHQGDRLPDAGRPGAPVGRYPDLVYFSFITLTTVGYGDILPIGAAARVLAVAEAFTGQIYLAILLGLLVGLYVSQRVAGDR
jgi:hypothetical protein